GYQINRDPAAAEGDWEVVAPPAAPHTPGGTGVPPVREGAEIRTGETPMPPGTPPATPPATPPRRTLVFLGDLVDRGPNTPAVLRLVMRLVGEGKALCVPGNHDVKLLRKLNGKNVRVAHGLAATLEQLEPEPPEFLDEVRQFIDSLISHYVLDDGRLVVAHAGLKENM